MKQPKKLSLTQKQCLSAHNLNAKEWMLVSESEFYIHVIHKETGKMKILDKYRKEVKRR